ncbi:hypothetical protein NO1_2231, partial [Candidatus Termititenax aidoneus]
MKKIILAIFTVMLALAIFGCGKMQQASGGGGGSSSGGGSYTTPSTLTIYGKVDDGIISDEANVSALNYTAQSFAGLKVALYKYGASTTINETEIKSDNTYELAGLTLNAAYTARVVGKNLESIVFGAKSETEQSKKINIDKISTVVAEAVSANAEARDAFENFAGGAVEKVKESMEAARTAAEEVAAAHEGKISKDDIAAAINFKPTRTLKLVHKSDPADAIGADGYDGFEINITPVPLEKNDYTESVRQNGKDFAMIYTEYTYEKGTTINFTATKKLGNPRSFLWYEWSLWDSDFAGQTLNELINETVVQRTGAGKHYYEEFEYKLDEHVIFFCGETDRWNGDVSTEWQSVDLDNKHLGNVSPGLNSVRFKKENDDLVFEFDTKLTLGLDTIYMSMQSYDYTESVSGEWRQRTLR